MVDADNNNNQNHNNNNNGKNVGDMPCNNSLRHMTHIVRPHWNRCQEEMKTCLL